MGLFSNIFKSKDNNDGFFNKVCVDKGVLDSVIFYAKEAYPHEFLSLLDGTIKNNVLYITGLIFIPGETSDTGAVLHYDQVPPNIRYYGSVHSHPGPSNRPSDADLETFSKRGVFHMIVKLPYAYENFQGYDGSGNPLDFEIGDFSHIKTGEPSIDDFFDEDDFLDDDEVFSDEDEEFLDSFDKKDKRTNYNEFSKHYNQSGHIPNPVSPDMERLIANPFVINLNDLDEENTVYITPEEAKNGITLNLTPGQPIPRIVITNDKSKIKNEKKNNDSEEF